MQFRIKKQGVLATLELVVDVKNAVTESGFGGKTRVRLARQTAAAMGRWVQLFESRLSSANPD